MHQTYTIYLDIRELIQIKWCHVKEQHKHKPKFQEMN